jgi:hypothetical protein
LRSTPERIRSDILDGVVPPVIPGSAYPPAQVGETYNVLFDLCAAADFCAENFPDLRDRFIALLGELQAEPMTFDPPLVPNDLMRYQFGLLDQIGPEFFADLAELNNKAARGGFAARIPVLIEALEARDEAAVRDLLGHGPVDDTPIQTPASAEDAFARDDMFIAPAIDVIFARALDRDGEETTISEDWATLVMGDFAERLTEGEETQAEVVKDMVDLAMVPLAGSDSDALTAFADTHLSPEVATDADALVAAMSRQQVRETMWAIQDMAGAMSGGSERNAVSLAVLYNINCAEDIGFTPVEEAQDYIDASPYPGLLTFGIEDYENMTLFCRFFPAPFTKDEMMSPVESDTPALLFLEGLDTHTAYPFGLVAAETLPNSHIVTWPSEGHVMAARSVDGCAGAIAATFLDDPAREPNIGCSQADYYTLPFQSAIESWSGYVAE